MIRLQRMSSLEGFQNNRNRPGRNSPSASNTNKRSSAPVALSKPRKWSMSMPFQSNKKINSSLTRRRRASAPMTLSKPKWSILMPFQSNRNNNGFTRRRYKTETPQRQHSSSITSSVTSIRISISNWLIESKDKIHNKITKTRTSRRNGDQRLNRRVNQNQSDTSNSWIISSEENIRKYISCPIEDDHFQRIEKRKRKAIVYMEDSEEGQNDKILSDTVHDRNELYVPFPDI